MTQSSTFTYSKMHMLTTLFTLLINSPSSFHCFISSTTDHLLRYWILDVLRFNLLILFSCLLQLECKLHEVRVCVCFVHWYIPSLENKAYHMMCVCEVAQSCPTLCDSMDCSPSGSSVHGILQARILEWVAISFSRASSWPRDWTRVSHIVGRHFTIWTQWALDMYWLNTLMN